MNTKGERNIQLDMLALGSDCPKCGSYSDEACTTSRSGRITQPHIERINRAVTQYMKGRK